MFDYDPNADELLEPIETFVPEVDPGSSEYKRLAPGQVSQFFDQSLSRLYIRLFRRTWIWPRCARKGVPRD